MYAWLSTLPLFSAFVEHGKIGHESSNKVQCWRCDVPREHSCLLKGFESPCPVKTYPTMQLICWYDYMFEVDKLFAKRCIPILEFCIPMPYIQYANEPTFHPATDSISSSIGNRSNRHSIKHFIQEILDNVNRLPNDMRIHTNYYRTNLGWEFYRPKHSLQHFI